MKTLKEYIALEIALVVFTEEVVRTSPTIREEEGELPIQPFFS